MKEHNMGAGGSMAYDVEDKKTSAYDDIVYQARQNSAAYNSQDDRPHGVTDLTIIMWANGFQCGSDGPFRSLDDPANTQFLAELKQGVVPTELRQKYPRGVAVGLEDRRSRDYRPPTPPEYISSSGEGTSMRAAAASKGGVVDLTATGGKPILDESKPKTLIQFKFYNGQRGRLEVNMTHTVDANSQETKSRR